MEGEDPDRTRPSLELPKLRRRKPRQRAEPTTPEPATPEPATPEPVAPEPVAPELVAPEPVAVAQVEIEPEPPRKQRRPRRPRRPGGMLTVVLTGALVGLALVGLTWAALRGCEAVQGTSSCGGTGYPMLLAILVALVAIGWLLLRLGRVPEPGSTSFLAVGLTAVIALLFLIDSLADQAMVVVIPLICAGSFAAAHWVTRTFAGD